MKNNYSITCLFDLDGTLLCSTNAIVSTFYHSFNQINYKFKGNDEDIKSLIGYPLETMYKKLGIKDNLIDKFVLEYKKRYKTISKNQTSLLPNALKSIKLANTFARVSIVTTKTRQATIPLLKHLKIDQYFEYIIGREDVINPKPHSEPILKVLDLMNIKDKKNIWMIGDTILDIKSANSSKINSIGLLCGYGKKEELEKLTPYIAKDSLEAIKMIKNSL